VILFLKNEDYLQQKELLLDLKLKSKRYWFWSSIL